MARSSTGAREPLSEYAQLAVVLLITVLLFPTVRIKRRLLKKLGINMPSRRQIQILEMKYRIPPKTIGKKADDEK